MRKDLYGVRTKLNSSIFKLELPEKLESSEVLELKNEKVKKTDRI